MKIKYISYRFVCPLICLILVACSSNSDTYVDPTGNFEIKKDIYSELLSLDEIQLNTPIQLMVLDSTLLIHDRFQRDEETFFFLLINRFSGENLRFFGREGRGPDEFLFPSIASRIPKKNNIIGIYNRNLFQFTEISVESVINEDVGGFTMSKTSEINTGYSIVAKIDQDLIIGTGFFDNGRYAISDVRGELISVSIDYPFENDFGGISKRDLGMAFQSVFKIHPDKSKIASATRASANLEILIYQNDSLKIEKKIHSGYPLFENESSNQRISVRYLPENRAGFLDLDVTKSFIYALYSGVERREGLSKYLTGNKVLIYDWEGNQILQLNLDKSVTNFAVDENDSFIYGTNIHDDGEPEIYIYELHELLFDPSHN